MRRVQPIQTSFSSGEISPLLLAHTNVDRYATGLLRCVNFIPRPQGPSEIRGSFEYVGEFIDDGAVRLTDEPRLIPLNVDQFVRFVAVIGEKRVKVYSDVGLHVSGDSGINLLRNSDFEAALLNWLPLTTGDLDDVVVKWVPEEAACELSVRVALTQAASIYQPITLEGSGTTYTLVPR